MKHHRTLVKDLYEIVKEGKYYYIRKNNVQLFAQQGGVMSANYWEVERALKILIDNSRADGVVYSVEVARYE